MLAIQGKDIPINSTRYQGILQVYVSLVRTLLKLRTTDTLCEACGVENFLRPFTATAGTGHQKYVLRCSDCSTTPHVFRIFRCTYTKPYESFDESYEVHVKYHSGSI